MLKAGCMKARLLLLLLRYSTSIDENKIHLVFLHQEPVRHKRGGGPVLLLSNIAGVLLQDRCWICQAYCPACDPKCHLLEMLCWKIDRSSNTRRAWHIRPNDDCWWMMAEPSKGDTRQYRSYGSRCLCWSRVRPMTFDWSVWKKIVWFVCGCMDYSEAQLMDAILWCECYGIWGLYSKISANFLWSKYEYKSTKWPAQWDPSI